MEEAVHDSAPRHVVSRYELLTRRSTLVAKQQGTAFEDAPPKLAMSDGTLQLCISSSLLSLGGVYAGFSEIADLERRLQGTTRKPFISKTYFNSAVVPTEQCQPWCRSKQPREPLEDDSHVIVIEESSHSCELTAQ